MKKYLITGILVLIGNAVYSQTKTVQYYYDKNNRMTGYAYEGLFQRGLRYDPAGNLVARNNEIMQTGSELIPENINMASYPNPFGESGFVIDVDTDQKNIDILLFDMTGKLVPVQYSHNNGKIHVAAGHLSPGVYLCRITYNRQILTMKVLRK